MGDLRTGLRAAVDETRGEAGGRAGGLPHRRLANECSDTDQRYFGLVVGFAREYDKNAGVGTVVAMMLPYFIWMQVLWMALFALWYVLGLPWGL